MQYYVVIDTNVLVSAMLKFQSIPWQIVNKALIGNLTPLLCDDIVAEYRDVMGRSKFKFDQNVVDILIDGIIDRGIYVDAAKLDETLPDLKDVAFYEVVMEARKNNDAYLITGNIKHFPIKPFIVTPKEMLDIIDNNDLLEL